LVVSAAGWAKAWDRVNAFSPESPPSETAATYALTLDQTNGLFLRAAGVNTSVLPHEPSVGSDCYAMLYLRFCQGCAVSVVRYAVPEQVTPELEPLWSFFDQIVGAAAVANPRNYCKPGSP
jgi:hypothetical protein